LRFVRSINTLSFFERFECFLCPDFLSLSLLQNNQKESQRPIFRSAHQKARTHKKAPLSSPSTKKVKDLARVFFHFFCEHLPTAGIWIEKIRKNLDI